jgi:uncharacterized membrane protein YGL010W
VHDRVSVKTQASIQPFGFTARRVDEITAAKFLHDKAGCGLAEANQLVAVRELLSSNPRRADATLECVSPGVESLERLSTMPRLRMHLEHYDESHRKWGNKLLHFAGIPLLLVSSLGLLSKLSLHSGAEMPALRPNAGWVVLIGAGFWYGWLDLKIGSLTLALWAACYVLGSELSAVLLAVLFGIGALAHAIGHYAIEGKPPAVFSRPVAVLEAPAWLVAIGAGLYR